MTTSSLPMPKVTYALGAAGLIPFIACAIAAMTPGSYQVPAFGALLAYAAVILAFLGGVHWGLVWGEAPPSREAPARLGLGTVPSLIGWAGLALAGAGFGDLALAVLIAGFGATMAVEQRWGKAGLIPARYLRLRWALSLVVVVVLVTVLVLRLIGAQIIF